MLAERKWFIRKVLPSKFWPSDHDTVLEMAINKAIPMEELTYAVEKRLILDGKMEQGKPSKHQVSQGMVYRNVSIRKPPACCFMPEERLTTDEEKAMAKAWATVKDHLNPEFKNGQWSHELATTWAEGDPKSRRRVNTAAS